MTIWSRTKGEVRTGISSLTKSIQKSSAHKSRVESVSDSAGCAVSGHALVGVATPSLQPRWKLAPQEKPAGATQDRVAELASQSPLENTVDTVGQGLGLGVT